MACDVRTGADHNRSAAGVSSETGAAAGAAVGSVDGLSSCAATVLSNSRVSNAEVRRRNRASRYDVPDRNLLRLRTGHFEEGAADLMQAAGRHLFNLLERMRGNGRTRGHCHGPNIRPRHLSSRRKCVRRRR